jgi:hypothetical protein
VENHVVLTTKAKFMNQPTLDINCPNELSMKVRLLRPIQLIIAMLLLALASGVEGCTVPKPKPDPLADWGDSGLDKLNNNKAIADDYQQYIRTLTQEERSRANPIEYFEDRTGQHAVRITIGLNGVVWRHILIYDKDNKRIKTMKYASGNYGG